MVLRAFNPLLVALTTLLAVGSLTSCGVDAQVSEATLAAEEAQDELTRALVSGVPRKISGPAGQTREYTIAVPSNVAAVTLVTAGKSGDIGAVLYDPSGINRCHTSKTGMAHTCRSTSPVAGKWTIAITSTSAFSGELTATNIVGDAGSDSADAGEADAGSVDAGTPDSGSTDAGSADAGSAHTTGSEVSVHTTMGLADDARIGDARRWLIVKPQYVVSFDSTTKTPNWVSWQMSNTWIGSASRSSSFHPDPDLPNTVAQAANADFDGTSFARGHMCPSGDRTSDSSANQSTFVFTNVVPQEPSLNNGPWKGLENEERQLAAAGKVLYITSGPIRGTRTIGNGVNVPLATWKVIVVTDGGGAASVTSSTRVIAVIMDNTSTISGNWTTFRTSVREIERRTGLNLLADVAPSVQDVVENQVDSVPANGG